MKIRIFTQCAKCLRALERENWNQNIKDFISRVEFRNGTQVHVTGPGKRYHQKHHGQPARGHN